MRHVQDRPSLGHFDMPPAALGTDEHKQVAGAFALVFVIVSFRLTRRARNGHSYFTDHLVGLLIETHAWSLGIFRLSIEIEHILHMIDELGAHRRDDPFFDLPGFQNVFLSVRRTVSYEMVSTILSSMSSSASKRSVQRVLPLGGAEQVVAIRKASCLRSSV